MNQYNPNIHHRRTIRLKGYDYSQAGAYFITIVTQKRMCLFGHVVGGKMILNDAGMATQNCWLEIPNHFPNVTLDEFVIMPNHVHGIIVINIVGANNHSPLLQQNHSPIQQNHSPIQQNHSPLQQNHSPIQQNHSPLQQNHSPLQQNHSPLQQNHSPLQNHSSVQSSPFRSPSQTIGSIIRGFKIGVTKWFHRNTDVYHVWQRNYYEHIIRNEKEMNAIREYIINNPLKWHLDENYKIT